jgi:hypothetical protein
MRPASKIGRPAKGKAAIMQVFEERYRGVTKIARGQLTAVANELIEAYAGGDKPTPRTVRDWINERLRPGGTR